MTVRSIRLGVVITALFLALASTRVVVAVERAKDPPPRDVIAPPAGGAAQEPTSGGEPSTSTGAQPSEGAAPGQTQSVPPGGLAVQPGAERRDPFRPFIRREAKAEEAEGIGVTAYELRQLTLVGVLVDVVPPRALLQDSSGMGYIVTPGSRVGRHGGVVAAVEPGRMIVEEKSLDFYGREQVTRQVIEIPKDLEPQAVGRE